MKSFVDIEATLAAQPPRLGARLAIIDTARGREQMYRDQLPELLLGLAEQTRVASITASNAIEGVFVEGSTGTLSTSANCVTVTSAMGAP